MPEQPKAHPEQAVSDQQIPDFFIEVISDESELLDHPVIGNNS